MSIQEAIKASKVEETEKSDANIEDTAGQVEVNSEGGKFSGVVSTEPLTNWDHIFKQFGLDPSEFAVVGDSVTMKAWQQSKRLENGDRDTITLYSYGARFSRRAPEYMTAEDIEAYIKKVNSWELEPRTFYSKGTPVAAVLNLADLQLGKGEGGGTTETLKRLERALQSFLAHVDEVRARGINLNELVLVQNGDITEGISGNYANQLHTVEGGLRYQMNLALEVLTNFARVLYPHFEKRQFVTVLCNHTQFGRQGGAKDSITGDEDNGGAFLAETLQRILHATEEFSDVKFTIPHAEMNVYTTAAGVKLGFNHGHKIPGKDASGFEKWLSGIVRSDKDAYETRLWITAHKHHLQVFDLGSATVIQCPSCDGGSKWLTDTTGKFANAGIVSVLVGNHHRLGWTDLQFL